jgi:hypothetical protein
MPGTDTTGVTKSRMQDWPRIIAAGLLLIVVTLIVILVLQGVNSACRDGGNDLGSYFLSSRTLWNGGNPYATGSPFPYIYPLFLAFAVIPLTALPCAASAVIWALLGLAALVGTLVLVRRHAVVVPPAWLILALCLVYYDVLQNNLVNGQVNLLVLVLCTLGFHFSRGDRDLAAALFFGAAAAIKLTPLILLGYLLVRRRWRALGATVLVFLVLCLLPGLVPGVDLGSLYGEYGRGFIGAKLAGGTEIPGHAGFSLTELMANAGLHLGSWATAFFLLLVPGATLWWDHRSGSRNDLRAFALYLLAILFVVPMSEVHHLVLALPGYVCLAGDATAPKTRTLRVLLIASLGIYLAGSLFWQEGPLYFLSLVLLVVGLIRGRNVDSVVA